MEQPSTFLTWSTNLDVKIGVSIFETEEEFNFKMRLPADDLALDHAKPANYFDIEN